MAVRGALKSFLTPSFALWCPEWVWLQFNYLLSKTRTIVYLIKCHYALWACSKNGIKLVQNSGRKLNFSKGWCHLNQNQTEIFCSTVSLVPMIELQSPPSHSVIGEHHPSIAWRGIFAEFRLCSNQRALSFSWNRSVVALFYFREV